LLRIVHGYLLFVLSVSAARLSFNSSCGDWTQNQAPLSVDCAGFSGSAEYTGLSLSVDGAANAETREFVMDDGRIEWERSGTAAGSGQVEDNLTIRVVGGLAESQYLLIVSVFAEAYSLEGEASVDVWGYGSTGIHSRPFTDGMSMSVGISASASSSFYTCSFGCTPRPDSLAYASGGIGELAVIPLQWSGEEPPYPEIWVQSESGFNYPFKNPIVATIPDDPISGVPEPASATIVLPALLIFYRRYRSCSERNKCRAMTNRADRALFRGRP
jgi:hypothetical protein